MHKKLLAVAVAGVLAAPAVALAQSSVTISGVFKVSFDNIKLSQTAKTPSSESRLADDSSAIRFNIVEDLGGGLQAIGQLDWRITMDQGGDAANGNNHVGLRHKAWGRLFMGRQDIHYFNRESNLTTHGSLKADSISLLSFTKGGVIPIANASRTPNLIHYTTPNWGGFTLIAAHSTSPQNGGQSPFTQINGSGSETDIGNGSRKGRAWYLNPNFQGRNFQVGYSYYSAKHDVGSTQANVGTSAAACALQAGAPAAPCAQAATTADDQRSDRLYGSFRWGGLHLGLAWDKTKLKAPPGFIPAAAGAAPAAGTTVSDRTAWSFPVEYTWGNHGVYAHYTKARDDKAIADTAAGNQSAKMFAIAYAYQLSKRTSSALTYAKITNNGAAAYNLFTSVGFLGSTAAAVAAGEDPRLLAWTLRHTF